MPLVSALISASPRLCVESPPQIPVTPLQEPVSALISASQAIPTHRQDFPDLADLTRVPPERSKPRLRLPAALAAILAIWAPAVGFGIHKLLQYSYTPGRPAAVSPVWPRNPWVAPVPGHPTLLVFVHPQCPCSRATIAELSRIMAVSRDRVSARIFFYAPSTEKPDWDRTDLWRDASAIPGVRAAEDRDGSAARLFGAFTSGETLLFGTDGRLAFHGGITPARGHAGDSSGQDAILSLLAGRPTTRHSAPVFGCSIQGGE